MSLPTWLPIAGLGALGAAAVAIVGVIRNIVAAKKDSVDIKKGSIEIESKEATLRLANDQEIATFDRKRGLLKAAIDKTDQWNNVAHILIFPIIAVLALLLFEDFCHRTVPKPKSSQPSSSSK